MSFQEAINYIDKSKQLGSRLGLERIARLCGLAGNPQDAVPAVHVAGTNGKGSTSSMLASILTSAGYRAGLYTSPYIDDVCECIRIDGEPMPHDEFAAVAGDVRAFAETMAGEGFPPTEFELETAIAFLWFQRSGCDAAVIETGLGGRLDATNVLKRPLAAVLTSISLDHMAILGDTIGKIAAEKCGIIKPGGFTAAYPLQQEEAWGVIRQYAGDAQSALVVPDMSALRELGGGLDGTDILYKGIKLHIPLIGRHQIVNAVTAAETALALRDRCGLALPDCRIAQGIERTGMALRQELISRSPIMLLDGAHNPDGLAALADTMQRHLAGRRTAVIMGMLADKEVGKSIGLIAPLCGRFIACRPASPRALPSATAAKIARAHCGDVATNDDYAGALNSAMEYAGPGGAVVVCGSLYLAGPMRRVILDHPGLSDGLL